MTAVTMPSLSDSMEAGTVLAWLKADGDEVALGEALVEIETDKATMTYESPLAGVLEIVAAEGVTYPVGELIARIGDAAAAPTTSTAPSSEKPAQADPVAAIVPPAAGAPPEPSEASIQATPVARRMARQHGISLADVRGTGPRGRIKRADVAAAAGVETPSPPVAAQVAPESGTAPTPTPLAAASPETTGGPKGTPGVHEPSRLQQTVARRMAEAKATVPHFQVQTDADMGAALDMREALKAQSSDGSAPSINDLIVKAAALALRRHPRANGAYRDSRFEIYPRVNVGIAVAAADALVVPTITDADTRSLGSIAAESRRLAGRVRSGEITPPELSGATFTISNLGMYGMTAIFPVINSPQAAILGVGATRATPALRDGRLVERHLMTLTLSCDHRILYGADAAQFLSTIRDLLEQPLGLIL